MREILFRGKRVDNGEWVEGHYATIQNPFSEDGRPVKHLICNGTNVFNYKIIPETIGQYTGLCDKNGKNGKKIFEGDIVLWCGIKGIVVWEGHKFYVKSNLLWDFSDDDCIEVIGNIHDNPELLRKEDEGK